MTTERASSICMGAALLGLSLALSACSSTGSNNNTDPTFDTDPPADTDPAADTDPPADTDPGPDPVVVERILASGEEAFPGDYANKVFPFYFAKGDAAGNGMGIGSAEFINDDTLKVTLPGQEPVFYGKRRGTNEWSSRSEGTLTGADLNSLLRLALYVPTSEDTTFALAGGIVGYAGFETAAEDRPISGSYTFDDESFGAIFLTVDGLPGAFTDDCVDCVELTADFGAQTIRGQVFQGGLEVLGLGLEVTNTLEDGEITEEGFTGNITSDWALVDEESTDPLPTIVANDTVTGRFFGNGADRAAMVYESDVEITTNLPDVGTINATMSGASDAFNAPDEPIEDGGT